MSDYNKVLLKVSELGAINHEAAAKIKALEARLDNAQTVTLQAICDAAGMHAHIAEFLGALKEWQRGDDMPDVSGLESALTTDAGTKAPAVLDAAVAWRFAEPNAKDAENALVAAVNLYLDEKYLRPAFDGSKTDG